MNKRFAPCIAAFALAACAAHVPLSYVSGVPLAKLDRDLYPLRLVSVDREINVGGHAELPMEAGIHSLVVAFGREQRTYALKVDSCTRYFIGARVNPMDPKDWKLEVAGKESLPGCALNAKTAG